MRKTKKKIPKYDTKTFTGKVVMDPTTNRKRVQMNHLDYYQHEVDQFAVNDEVWIKMTNRKQKRTDAQNNYMHLYFSLIAKSSGHSMQEIKSWAKGKFLSQGITEVFGDRTRKVKDTAKLTVSEMMEFIARVETATEVPAPNPEPFNLPMTYEEYKALKKKQEAEYMKMEPKIKK